MSTSSTSSTTFTSHSNYTLSSLTGSSTLQLTGVSSALNTNQIVQELMAVKQQPLDNLENQQALLNARNTELETLQGELQTVQTTRWRCWTRACTTRRRASPRATPRRWRRA